MTTREIYNKYKEIFILVMEAAGEETDNTAYKNVEKILNQHDISRAIDQFIEQEAPFQIFISICIVALLLEIHEVSELTELDPDETYELADYIFQHYLKKPTRKFTSMYGLPVINSLDTYFKVISAKRK